MSDTDPESNEWQLSCKELKQRGAHLLKSISWSDCSIIVGQKEIPFRSHKLILSMASPVFEAMLFNGMAVENERTLRFPDIEPEAFEAMLNYIYTENINISSYEQACTVYRTASRFLLVPLANVCAAYMACNLTPDTACQAYEMAHQFGDQPLMDESLQMIKQNIKDILTHPSFERAPLHTVVKIFSVEDLQIDSELELFEAAERYARTHSKKRSASPVAHSPKKAKTDDEEMKEVNEHIKKLEGDKMECDINQNEVKILPKSDSGCEITEESPSDHCMVPVLQQIRFLTLSARAFALGPARSPLLPPGAALALLQNIAGVRVRMPEGFSTSRKVRYQRPPEPNPQEPTSATFVLSIPVGDGIRSARSHLTPPRQLGGVQWLVAAVPRLHCTTSKYSEDWYIGLYLRCLSPPGSPWSRSVCAEFRLLATGEPARTQRIDTTFTSSRAEHGCPLFITCTDMFTMSHYVDNKGNLTAEVHVEIKT